MRLKLVFASLMLVLPILGWAQKFGDWSLATGKDGLPYMYTMNDSGVILGKWCDGEAQSCFWMLLTQQKCETGEIPALVNASSGALSVTLTCTTPYELAGKTYSRLIFAEFDQMNTMMLGDDYFGIAVATVSGNFRVSRFSLSGAKRAITRMHEIETNWVNRQKQKGSTKDTTL